MLRGITLTFGIAAFALASCKGGTTFSGHGSAQKEVSQTADAAPQPKVVATPIATPQPTSGAPVAIAQPSPTPDPCASSGGSANAPSNKQILFYAPASYAATTEATSNVYLNAVVKNLQLATNGFKITTVTKVSDSGISFDACSLHRAYKQIWLWLPCNNKQNMDDTSFKEINKYYDYGGGLVVFSDAHYYTANQPNTHCDATNLIGTTDLPSDAARVAAHMGFKLVVASNTSQTTSTAAATHPLLQAFANLRVSPIWNTLRVSDIPSGGMNFPNYPASGGIYDETLNPPKNGAPPKLGVLFAGLYSYHTNPSADDLTAYEATAAYLDAHVEANASTSATHLMSIKTPSFGHFNPNAFLTRMAEIDTEELRHDLKSEQREKVGQALRSLAERGEITLDELMSFAVDERWLIRYSAAIAASSMPHDIVVPALKKLLAERPVNPDLAIFAARALAGESAVEAVPALKAAFDALPSSPEPIEHKAHAEVAMAIKDLENLR